MIESITDAFVNFNKPTNSSLKKTIPFIGLVALIVVAVTGIQDARDSIDGISRQAALSTQSYKDEALMETVKGIESVSTAVSEDIAPYIPMNPNTARRIGLIHLGRSGGSTITHAFPRLLCRRNPQNQLSPKLLQECLEEHTRYDSPLSSQLELALHSSAEKPSQELYNFSTFLFTIRNPLTRLVSAYHALHHDVTDQHFASRGHDLKNNFYRLCFPSMTHLRTGVHYISHPELTMSNRRKEISTIPKEQTDYCQQLLLAVLRGTNPLVEKINVHLHKNYQFYHKATIGNYPEKEVVALRMEHMWEDINALDVAIGGTGNLVDNDKKGKHTNKNIKQHELAAGDDQVKELCCLVWEDLEAYQIIVNRARNLEYPSKLETIQDLWNTCGIRGPELKKFGVSDGRVDASNAIAQEKNGRIVVFSWYQWHQRVCPRTLWDHQRFNFATPVPDGILP